MRNLLPRERTQSFQREGRQPADGAGEARARLERRGRVEQLGHGGAGPEVAREAGDDTADGIRSRVEAARRAQRALALRELAVRSLVAAQPGREREREQTVPGYGGLAAVVGSPLVLAGER